MTRCRGARPARSNGFAYLWVLLVVAFMGLGLSLGVDVYMTSVQRDKERELLSIGHQFRTAIARYVHAGVPGAAASAKSEYPKTLADLLDDKRFLGTRRHLRKIFVDPLTGKDEWGVVMLGDRIVGVHSLSNAVPIQQTHFDDDDRAFEGKGKISEWVFVYPIDLRVGPEGAVPSVPAMPASAASAPVGVPFR